jgi:hypothetical protein
LKKLLLTTVAVCFAVSPAFAITCVYDWEDCGTILGMYPEPDGVIVDNVTAPDPVYEGLRSLKITDNHPTGTPQAFVAWVTGCLDGDVIEASFWRYDVTPGTAPSCRIWAHYADDVDVTSYYGSASGNSDYGPGLGWDLASHTWTFTAPDPAATALIIECRTYSNPGDIVWLDYMTVTVNPNHGQCIHVPLAGPSATDNTCWGKIKALYQ